MLIWPTPKPAVLTAITILDSAFADYAFVSAKLPSRSRPERFVQVKRIGGGLDNMATDRARILVDCYAKDVGQVEAMLNTARTALRNAGGTTVSTAAGAVFVRSWSRDNIVSDYQNPEVLEYERGQLNGELEIKAN